MSSFLDKEGESMVEDDLYLDCGAFRGNGGVGGGLSGYERVGFSRFGVHGFEGDDKCLEDWLKALWA